LRYRTLCLSHRALVRAPEIVVATWQQARKETPGLTENQVREAFIEFDGLWDQLFPAEQARLVRLLVERAHDAHLSVIISRAHY
jgi:hypothetical protein